MLSVNKFACASWYSIYWQNEFKTVIKSCEIFNACAAIDDQPQSQQVPGIHIESYTLAPFPNTLTFSGGYYANKCNIVLNKVKK